MLRGKQSWVAIDRSCAVNFVNQQYQFQAFRAIDLECSWHLGVVAGHEALF